MFLLVSVRHVGAHPDEHQHGVSIQISINLGKTFLRVSRIRNIPLIGILARVFAYLPPNISQILDFIYWTVLIFILIYFEWRDTENPKFLPQAPRFPDDRPRSSQPTCFSCGQRGHIARFGPRNWNVYMLEIYRCPNKCLPVWLLMVLLFYFGLLLPLSIWSVWDGFSKQYPILCLWRGPWIGLVGGSPFFHLSIYLRDNFFHFSLFLGFILAVWSSVETCPKIC